MRVLIIEDHDALREVLEAQLTARGFDVVTAYDAESVDDELADEVFDAYIVDLTLPGEDGLSLVKRLRAAEPDAGIVIVTGRTALEDRIAGYHHGADAYLAKPVMVDELSAVLGAVGRRREDVSRPLYRLDPHLLVLHGPAGAVRISPTHADLLVAFARAPDHRLEAWRAMERLGRSPDTYSRAALAVQLARVRERLKSAGAARDAIEAVRGFGYQLRIDLEIVRGGRRGGADDQSRERGTGT